jgi:hypothetical protein
MLLDNIPHFNFILGAPTSN